MSLESLIDAAYENVREFETQSGRTIEWLENHAYEHHNGEEDLVISEIYNNSTTSGITLVKGEIVVSGLKTRKKFPFPYQIHFKKTMTENSPPIKRGETPKSELKNTFKVIQTLSESLRYKIEPLGIEPLTYRSRIIPGRTVAGLSPFTDLNYDDAIKKQVNPLWAKNYQHQIQQVYDTVIAMHNQNVVHGDLHLENILWLGANEKVMVQAIDFASSKIKKEFTKDEWIDACNEDLSEIYREAILLELNQDKILEHPLFKKANLEAELLMPPEVYKQLYYLQERTKNEKENTNTTINKTN